MAENEKVFYEKNGIRVTNSRFVVPGQTYALSGVTSVKSVSKSTTKASVILAIFGIWSLSIESYFFGVLLLGAALLWYLQSKHMVVLTTSSGESEALTSKDQSVVQEIIGALNEAIIERG